MASPLVRRQVISIPPLFPSSSSQTSSVPTPPPPGTSSSTSSTGVSSSIGSPGISGPTPGFPSTLLPTSSSEPTPTLTPGLPTPPPASPTPPGQVTTTETTSTTAPPSNGTSVPKGNSFLKNKPLSGFVFGLAGLAVLIIVIIAVTSYVRRRNRKRLLTDASNFSFDPKDVEDRTSSAEEKYSHPGHTGYHSSGHGHGEYALGAGSTSGFAAVGAGGVPRPAPSSPPISYFPQDYAGHDGGYPAQYHNLGNAGIGYGATPNPYDMYGPRNGGAYPISQVQYDQYYPPGPSGDHYLVTDHGAPVPRQLQPGVHSVQDQTFVPPSFTNPPQLNRSPPIPPTISPPPATLQPPASNQYDPPRLPTPDYHPGAFKQWKSSDDDAYGGASLSHDDSPPGLRTLQVANI